MLMTRTTVPFSVLVEDCYFTCICSYLPFSWTNFHLPWKFAGEIRIPSAAYLSVSIEAKINLARMISGETAHKDHKAQTFTSLLAFLALMRHCICSKCPLIFYSLFRFQTEQ